jgi:hypothetical protein
LDYGRDIHPGAMSVHTVALTIHVACGSVGLVLGPVAMFSGKRRGIHTRTGEAYHWVFLVLFLSAVGLAVLNWDEVWWLAPVGAFSYGFALLGYLAAKRRWKGWLRAHVIGQGGSYVAMVTALLVVNTGGVSPLPWVVPTLIGTPIIRRLSNQIAAGKRPKSWRTAPGIGCSRHERTSRSGARG